MLETLPILSALIGLGIAVDVQGDASCPPAAEVAGHLTALLPQLAPSPGSVVRIARDGADLRITLEKESGVIFHRRLPRTGTCSELAEAVAVVVAAWEIDRHLELAARTPLPSAATGTTKPNAGVATTAEPTAPIAAPSRADVAASPLLGASLTPLLWEVGGSTSAVFDSAGVVPGLQLTAGARGTRFGLRLAISGESSRNDPFERGHVLWQRFTAGVGPRFLLVDSAFTVDLGAEVFLGMTTVTGKNFEKNDQATGLSPGIAATVRVGRRLRLFHLWVEAGGRGWLIGHRAAVETMGLTSRFSLPVLDSQVGLGASIPLTRSPRR